MFLQPSRALAGDGIIDETPASSSLSPASPPKLTRNSARFVLLRKPLAS
jgi:hypothetical protein